MNKNWERLCSCVSQNNWHYFLISFKSEQHVVSICSSCFNENSVMRQFINTYLVKRINKKEFNRILLLS